MIIYSIYNSSQVGIKTKVVKQIYYKWNKLISYKLFLSNLFSQFLSRYFCINIYILVYNQNDLYVYKQLLFFLISFNSYDLSNLKDNLLLE